MTLLLSTSDRSEFAKAEVALKMSNKTLKIIDIFICIFKYSDTHFIVRFYERKVAWQHMSFLDKLNTILGYI